VKNGGVPGDASYAALYTALVDCAVGNADRTDLSAALGHRYALFALVSARLSLL
jgi:hypothetical protein